MASIPLTNFEVVNRLKEIKQKKNTTGMDTGQQATIVYEALKYFECAPCKTQSFKSIDEFSSEIKQFDLTQAQYLMLINNPPKTLVQLNLILGPKFKEAELEDIMRITAKYFNNELNC